MRQPLIAAGIAAAAVLLAAAAPLKYDRDLVDAVKAPTRTPANVERDVHRHPLQTLTFFGVKAKQTVVEIWPGGGWYTEILAPLTNGKGTLYAVDFYPDGLKGIQGLKDKDAATYGEVKTAGFPWAEGQPKVPDSSADVVLTFRNVHNWRMGYKRDGKDYSAEAFAAMYAMLKPGGVLGVVDHRLPEDASAEREKSSGYIKVSTVKKLAEAAGFKFVGEAGINANPKDSADWERGVWTLPPRLARGDEDRAKYVAIGESDRMTLKFRKPK